MTLLFPLLMSFSVLVSAAWSFLSASLFIYLKENHAERYDSLGRPDPWKPRFSNSWRFVGFLAQPGPLDDQTLFRRVLVLRLVFVTRFVVIAALLWLAARFFFVRRP